MVAAIALALLLSHPRPQMFAHYMPWFESKPISGSWGWHWTMNHFDPDQGQIASRFMPQIGPYDSNDPDALEYEVLEMKFAGLDGAIIDWYGKEDVYDYATNHRNTLQIIRYLKKAGLKFAICFEDGTMPNLIKFGKIAEASALEYGRKLIQWVSRTWFSDKNYVRLQGKPVLLVFGPQYFKGEQWTTLLAGVDAKAFGVNGKYDFDTDGYAWPYPKEGNERMARFYRESSLIRGFIAGAYPRFEDIYNEAGVRESWGRIPDDGGRTLERTLSMALKSRSPIIQIATWNDWGEGTQIEPSKQYGYRDLERIQKFQCSKFSPADLSLPYLLYRLRKSTGKDQKLRADRASRLLFSERTKAAAKLLEVSPTR
jgi:hypothetical protein